MNLHFVHRPIGQSVYEVGEEKREDDYRSPGVDDRWSLDVLVVVVQLHSAAWSTKLANLSCSNLRCPTARFFFAYNRVTIDAVFIEGWEKQDLADAKMPLASSTGFRPVFPLLPL